MNVVVVTGTTEVSVPVVVYVAPSEVKVDWVVRVEVEEMTRVLVLSDVVVSDAVVVVVESLLEVHDV